MRNAENKKKSRKPAARRRNPVQERARFTVEAMLDAAVKQLKQDGASSITTNRIAEVAGVSIGSVYQYFPNKRAIFVALHARHIDQVDCVIHRTLGGHAESPLEDLIEALVNSMVEVHTADPELSELLQSEVPHRADSTRAFSVRFHEAFRSALAPHAKYLGGKTDLDTRAFFLGNLLDGLGHAIILRRPRSLSLARAKAECCKAILAYLAC
jgi:AcrR family transcriptional regulator